MNNTGLTAAAPKAAQAKQKSRLAELYDKLGTTLENLRTDNQRLVDSLSTAGYIFPPCSDETPVNTQPSGMFGQIEFLLKQISEVESDICRHTSYVSELIG